MANVLCLDNVSKIYQSASGELRILTDISMQVKPQEFIAVMGPSGSGKTTLLNILGCLDKPTAGSYHLQGEAIRNQTDNELAQIRNRYIGFIFQAFHLIPRLAAWKNVELPMIYAGIDKGERMQKAHFLLQRVGLSNRANHVPSALSGGERQRVAIARALACDPSLLLADEPTGSLDQKTGQEILLLFARLNQEGCTILMVTHDEAVASKAGRTITIQDGILQ